MAHATLGPSSAKRWMYCTKSIALIDQLKQEGKIPESTTSDAAEEGTAAHTIFEHRASYRIMTLGHVLPMGTIGRLEAEIKEIDPKFDQDQMADDVQIGINYILNLIKSEPDAKVWLEKRVGMTHTSQSVWGTADAIVHLPQQNKLFVVDLKYGRVEVQPNCEQLIIYAIATIETMFYGGRLPDVTCVIVQPRVANPIKEYHLSLDEMQYDFMPKLKAALLAIGSEHYRPREGEVIEPADNDYHVSESSCGYCPARAHCPAAAQYAADMCAFTALVDGDEDVPGIDAMLDSAQTLKGWITAIESRALELLEAGETIPGWCLGTSRPHRRWVSDTMVMAQMASAGFDMADIAPPKILSPAQMSKLVKKNPKKIAYSDIEMYIETPPGKPKLTREKP